MREELHALRLSAELPRDGLSESRGVLRDDESLRSVSS